MNRGSGAFALSDYRTVLRFNEAPIHESGKCDRRDRAAWQRTPLQ